MGPPKGKNNKKIKKYKKDSSCPNPKKGSITGKLPIQLNIPQLTTNIQNHDACHGLKTELLIKKPLSKKAKRPKTNKEAIIKKKPNNLFVTERKIA